MKFKNPKSSIGLNTLSLLGWTTAFLFMYFMPYGYEKYSTSDSGRWFAWILLCFMTIAFISVAIIIYVLEKTFNFEIKNNFILENRIYSYIFEFGFFLYTFPIIWLYIYCNYTFKPIIYLICFYLSYKLIQVLKNKFQNK